jgi:hypothetical protein
MRFLLISMLFLLTTPAFAKGAASAKASPALAKLAAEYLKANPKDVRVLVAAAGMAEEPGGGALVRVDDGADGGNPICYLLTLAGRPSSPARIDASLKFAVCPRADQGKTSRLERMNLGRRNAWLLRLDSARWDSMAKGGESALYWAIATDMGDGAGLRPVFERTSTTFKSKDQAALNQSEICKTPTVAISAGEPQGASIVCDVESMMGTLAKRSEMTFGYMWDGSQFAPK